MLLEKTEGERDEVGSVPHSLLLLIAEPLINYLVSLEINAKQVGVMCELSCYQMRISFVFCNMVLTVVIVLYVTPS